MFPAGSPDQRLFRGGPVFGSARRSSSSLRLSKGRWVAGAADEKLGEAILDVTMLGFQDITDAFHDMFLKAVLHLPSSHAGPFEREGLQDLQLRAIRVQRGVINDPWCGCQLEEIQDANRVPFCFRARRRTLD